MTERRKSMKTLFDRITESSRTGANMLRMAGRNKESLITVSIFTYVLVYLVVGIGGLSFQFQPALAELYSQSNTAAPQGAAWIESSDLHWTDGSEEYWLKNENVVTTSPGGSPGAFWIEGDSLHWIDQNTDERSLRGVTVTTSPGGSSGAVWIEDGDIHYIDASGTERRTGGEVVFYENFEDGSADGWTVDTADCGSESGVRGSGVCEGDTWAICPSPFESYYLEQTGSDTHVSPAIDLSSYTRATLWVGVASESMDSTSEDVLVEVYDGSSWNTVVNLYNQPENGTYPIAQRIDVSSYINSNFKIRIRNTGGGCGDHGFLDEVAVVGGSPKFVQAETFNDGSANSWTIDTADCANSGVTSSGACSGDTAAICPSPYGSNYLLAEGDDTHTWGSFDLSGYSAAFMDFSMASESMDNGDDSTRIQVYDGSSWQTIRRIHNEPTSGSYPVNMSAVLTPFLNSNFQVRIQNTASNGCGDQGFIDEATIQVID